MIKFNQMTSKNLDILIIMTKIGRKPQEGKSKKLQIP